MLARVSELESFRRFLADEEAELSGFVAQMRGDFQATPAMLAGTAFHAALETASPGEFDTLTAGDYTFIIDADAEIELPTIREIRASRTYAVDGGEIIVSGQVDCIHGKRVDDHKTTAQMNAESYWSGYQWRFYLDIHCANVFRWNVFDIREASDRYLSKAANRPAGLVYVIHGAHRIEQFRYPGMREDCERLASAFYRFAREHLPERFVARAAA